MVVSARIFLSPLGRKSNAHFHRNCEVFDVDLELVCARLILVIVVGVRRHLPVVRSSCCLKMKCLSSVTRL